MVLIATCKNNHDYEWKPGNKNVCPYCEEDNLSFNERYEVKQKIDEGGMGSVWKVYDRKLDRFVALKRIKGQGSDKSKRFVLEIETLKKLNHPNIINILDFGEETDFYYTMEYIDGVTLSEFIEKSCASYEQIAQLFLFVVKALKVCHRKNIIHRDIKPENILITPGDPPVPKLIDFGLAKDLQSEQGLTQTKEVMGTLGYMAPEQQNNLRNIDQQTDIYALSATLYKILTNEFVLRDKKFVVIPPKKWVSNIPLDLEIICLKGLEEKRANRYLSMQQVEEDLKAFLQKKPLCHAKIPNMWTHIRKFILRHPIATSLVSSFVIIAIYLSLFAFLQWRTTKKYLTLSEQNLGKVYLKEVQRLVEEKQYSSAKILAHHVKNILVKPNSIPSLEAQEILTKYPDIRFLWHSKVSQHHQGFITSLAIGNGFLASASSDRTVKIWDLATQELKTTVFNHQDIVNDIIFSSYHNAFISCSRDKTISIWYTSQENSFSLVGHTQSVVGISQLGNRLASADSMGNIKVWNINKKTEEQSWRTIPTTKIILLSGGDEIITSHIDKSVRLWNIKEKTNTILLQNLESFVTDIVFSKEQNLVVVSTQEGKVYYHWLMTSKSSFLQISKHSIHQLVFYKDSIICSTNQFIYQVKNNQISLIIEKTRNQIYALCINNQLLHYAGNNRTILTYDLDNQKHIGTIDYPSEMKNVSFSPSGDFFLGSEENKIKLWNSYTKEEKVFFYESHISDACFHPEDRMIVTLHENGEICSLFWETGKVEVHQAHNEAEGYFIGYINGKLVSCGLDGLKFWKNKKSNTIFQKYIIDVSTNGENLAYLKLDNNNRQKSVVLYNLEDKSEKLLFSNEDINQICISEKNTVVASNAYGIIQVWEQGKEKLVIDEISSNTSEMIISPNSQILAIATFTKEIYLWDLVKNEKISKILLKDNANSLAFSPDSKILLLGCFGYVSLWDISLSKAINVYQTNTEQIMNLCFDPEGKKVSVVGFHGILQRWDIEMGSCFYQKFDPTKNKVYFIRHIDVNNLFLGKYNKLEIYNVESDKTTVFHKGERRSDVYFSEKGTIATKDWNGKIEIWKYFDDKIEKTGVEVPTYIENPADIIFYSNDNFMITAFGEGEIGIWNVKNGKQVRLLRGHSDFVPCLAIHPSGKILASGSEDGTVKVWDIETGNLLYSLSHGNRVLSVIWDIEGERIVSAATSGEIKIWKNKIPTVLQGHDRRIFMLERHPTNNTFLSAGYHNFKLWDMDVQFVDYSKYLVFYDIKDSKVSWKENTFLNSYLMHPKTTLGFEPNTYSYLKIKSENRKEYDKKLYFHFFKHGNVKQIKKVLPLLDKLEQQNILQHMNNLRRDIK